LNYNWCTGFSGS